MSAQLQSPPLQFEALVAERLDEVMAIERQAYAMPWTRGNFTDSLAHGYQMQMLTAMVDGRSQVLGYFVAMQGVDEVHLLNITVAPPWQGQGLARMMLEALAVWSRGVHAAWLWLEVRRSNTRAQELYKRCGFTKVGERKAYYPSAEGPREDALMMCLKL